jgi:hypothetical protein
MTLSSPARFLARCELRTTILHVPTAYWHDPVDATALDGLPSSDSGELDLVFIADLGPGQILTDLYPPQRSCRTRSFFG